MIAALTLKAIRMSNGKRKHKQRCPLYGAQTYQTKRFSLKADISCFGDISAFYYKAVLRRKDGGLQAVTDNITNSNGTGSYGCSDPNGREQSKRDFRNIIFKIMREYGNNITEDTERFNALLMDFAPDMSKERKLIINALKEGVLIQLRRCIEEHCETAEEAADKCTAMLVSEMFITEEAARYAVGIIADTMKFEDGSRSRDVDVCGECLNGKQLLKGQKIFGTVVTEKDLREYDSIGYKAFALNKELEQVNIPENIKSIRPKAFYGCRALKRVSISAKTEKIGREIFDGCTALENIETAGNPNYCVCDSFFIDRKNKVLMRYINSGAETVSVPDGIKTISRRAFEGSEPKSVKISECVEKIEDKAFFYAADIERIDTDGRNKSFRSIDGVLYSRDGRELICYPVGKRDTAYFVEDGTVKIGKRAFGNAAFLSGIVFNNSLKEIAESAFENCCEIENIILPESVELIGERAFRYCEKMISVILPHNIVRIGDCAFQGCRRLKSISIPKNVREIGNMAFMGCASLEKAVIQENVSFMGNEVFCDCPNIEVTVKGNEYAVMYCKMHKIRYSVV